MTPKTRFRLRLILLALVLGGAYLALHTYVERFAYNPSPQLNKTPRDVDLPFDNIVVTASDGVHIDGWLVLQHPGEDLSATNSTTPMLLFLHGGEGNMSDRLEKIHLFHDIGLNVFIIDYRGYGKSEGSPNEEGLTEDALAARSYLVDQRGVKPEHLYIYGEGLGAAVGIALATKADAAGLITEGATASVLEKIQQTWPLFPWQYLVRDTFESVGKISEVHVPVLLIHSVDDDRVAFSDSQRLFALAHEPRQLVEIHGSHKDAFVNSFDAYYDAVSRFVHGHYQRSPEQPTEDETTGTSSSTSGGEPASKEPTP